MTVVFNGKQVPADTAVVPAASDGFQFGAGVFTTIRVRGGRAEFLREHFERLARDAAALGLAKACEYTTFSGRCAACIAADGVTAGGLKAIWFSDGAGRVGELISSRPHGYGPEAQARGFSLRTVRCDTREKRMLAGHKTLNYFEHVQAKRGAVSAGFDEALWVDAAGRVLEGATTNVFAVFPDEIVTPDARAGLLPGVVRSVVLRLAMTRAIREATLSIERLGAAEEVFVTNALMGVMPVRAIDGRVWDVARARMTCEIAKAFERDASGRF